MLLDDASVKTSEDAWRASHDHPASGIHPMASNAREKYSLHHINLILHLSGTAIKQRILLDELPFDILHQLHHISLHKSLQLSLQF